MNTIQFGRKEIALSIAYVSFFFLLLSQKTLMFVLSKRFSKRSDISLSSSLAIVMCYKGFSLTEDRQFMLETRSTDNDNNPIAEQKIVIFKKGSQHL